MDAIYPLAFVQNVVTTSLIALRILQQHRASLASGFLTAGSRISLLYVVRVIVESAALYTVQLLVLIVLYALKHPAQLIVQGAIVPTTGMSLL